MLAAVSQARLSEDAPATVKTVQADEEVVAVEAPSAVPATVRQPVTVPAISWASQDAADLVGRDHAQFMDTFAGGLPSLQTCRRPSLQVVCPRS